MNLKKELLAYLISGGITTGVNYFLYAALLFLHLPWLVSNSIAWAGAVLAAYVLNRRGYFTQKIMSGQNWPLLQEPAFSHCSQKIPSSGCL